MLPELRSQPVPGGTPFMSLTLPTVQVNPDRASSPGCPFLRIVHAYPQTIRLKPGSLCMQ
jgi:hypothetical protein